MQWVTLAALVKDYPHVMLTKIGSANLKRNEQNAKPIIAAVLI